VEDWKRDFAAYVEGRRMALRGTDAAGHQLVVQARPTSEADRIEQARTCWITPDRAVLPTTVPTRPGQKCEPAIRWR
jgi:hypothetical protein